MMIIKGKAFVLGDDIDTDIIIPTEYLAMKNVDEMKKYAFSPLRPELAGLIRDGDILIAGKNFGCGSSREQAPEILKSLNIGCIIAKSFARIFYRNAVNNGLLLIENPLLADLATEGHEVTVSPGKYIEYMGKKYDLTPLPENLMEIIKAGGLVQAMKKKNG
ncbi:MAG TPA: 3-isopropylmalate dehydratase [Anaerovoracaceae bacterium]|nr:3-isopropylmalate dehydratase [Anaerovoracaceae bacterium]